jgi:predicted ribosome quality control (RQC) complex YloA/Tae2 family protein
MNIQSASGPYESDTVVAFPPGSKDTPRDDADQLNKAGHTILRLLHKAAGVAEANSQQALEMAQKLSHQLQAAEGRIAELEAEVELYRDKADRAEQWLHKVYTEIEDRFIRRPEEKRRVTLAATARRT